MSFILDALKKSEAERRQGEVPRLQDEPGPTRPRRWSFWPLFLALALLLNGVVLGCWLLTREGGPPSAEMNAEAGDQAPAVYSLPAGPAGRPLPATPSALRAAAAAPSGPLAAAERPAPQPVASAPASRRISEGADPPPVPESAPLKEASPAAVLVASEPLSAPEVSPLYEFPPLSELSAERRSGLPDLNLQLHFYSPVPEKRLVRLNGVNLREGNQSADGLSIVEIVPEGVNLSCAGVRFFLPTVRR